MADVLRYALIKTNDENPADIDFELGPVYETDVAPPEDSYVAEATALEYFADDPRATAFIALASTAIAWYLARATKIIDALPLRGVKYLTDGTQDLEFPRTIDGVTVGDEEGNAVTPQQVKDACCEEALAIYLAGSSGGISELQAQGIQSMSVGGKLSYTFVAGAGKQGLQSATAKRYMRRYIGAEVR